MKKAFLLFTHCLMLVLGFAAGVYFLPIVTQPPAPGEQAIGEVATKALFTGHFERDLSGSDALHYGDGNLYISDKAISFEGNWHRDRTTISTCRRCLLRTKPPFSSTKQR